MRTLAIALLLWAPVACHRARPASDTPPAVAREAPATDLRFVVVGDTGMGNDEEYRVGAAMHRLCRAEGCDFVLLLGDNIYLTGVASAEDPQWRDKFEEPFAGLSMPFWATLGNHDYGNAGIGDDFERPEGQLAYARRGGKFRMPARRYQFTQGPALFVSLDTNAAKYGIDGSQAAEVSAWLQQPARWRFAFGHHPYLSNGPHGNAGDYDILVRKKKPHLDAQLLRGGRVKALLEGAVCGKADVYFAGHDHSRQWLLPTCRGTELVVSGAGAEATSIEPRNLARYADSSLGFLYVVLTDGELRARFVDDKGQTNFERTLTKAAQQ